MTKFNVIRNLSVAQQISASFISVILIGSLLLSLPVTQYDNAPATNYLDHLFNTVSMVCVTGLSVFPIGDVYNGLGQFLVMCLMQIGGLGLVSLIAFSYYSINRRMSLRQQEILQSSIGSNSSADLRHYLFRIYKITFTIECLAALTLMIDFIPRFGWQNGIFNSFFLAVSAFCNAGFDNLGSTSLIHYKLNWIVNLVVAFSIISGGLGFRNWMALIDLAKSWFKASPHKLGLLKRNLTIQTRLVLTTTAIILLIGTLLAWILEQDNPGTIGSLSFYHQVLVSFFQTVTMRTAGFATIDYTKAGNAVNFIFMIQMLIGGAPGGTAGGLKVIVTAITFLIFRSEFLGQTRVSVYNRTIPTRIVKQTLTILIFFFVILIIGYICLLEFEPNISPFRLFFEACSALATVGVSMDVTSHLSTAGRWVIMALMFFGRVGPITVLLSLRQKSKQTINYARVDLTLG
ncbi:potassium uptake protein [Streptococcus criceti]|uniref:K+ transporter (Trk) family protein n=1 Tax=Streptococcus criceti HS-6 TaxID=873449 RepID=G5JST1_STRCG|nr:potassium transporter TrkG [Streptococcus criceti]EHI73685.1 K+ transporter (Trk) family protein [Streptococcus criceti HS-6]SUN37558.1 potassium uptake protein [Streptococcus criceti]